MGNDRLRIEYVPLSTAVLWERNPKRHDLGKMAESIQRHGFKDAPKYEPALNDGQGGIVDGNGRIETLQWMQRQGQDPPRGIAVTDDGEWAVPVQFGVDAPSEKAAESYAVDANNLTMAGGDYMPLDVARMWDSDGYLDLLEELAADEVLPVTMDGDDLDVLLRELGDGIEPPPDPGPQTDRAAELQEKWQVERGQVWEIVSQRVAGECHRLMCGDATDEGDVGVLMNGLESDLVATDPPYMTTDLTFDKQGVDLQWFKIVLGFTKKNSCLVCFSPVEVQAEIAKVWSMRFSGAWVKEKGMMRTHSAKKPMNQFELYCVYADPEHKISKLTWNQIKEDGYEPYRKVQRRRSYKRGGRDQIDRANTMGWTEDGYVSENDGFRYQTDVVFAATKGAMKEDEQTSHPTQKPTKVMSVFLRWLSNPDDVVLDPFLGSGTTMVSAEQTGRTCYGMEIEPKYCAVALERLAGMGLDCRLVE